MEVISQCRIQKFVVVCLNGSMQSRVLVNLVSAPHEAVVNTIRACACRGSCHIEQIDIVEVRLPAREFTKHLNITLPCEAVTRSQLKVSGWCGC